MLGDRLKALRQETGKTQESVANDLKLTRASYSHFENNRNQPDGETLIALANYYNVTTDYLLGNNQTPEWATEKDTIDLGNFLNDNAKFAYNGSSLTDEEKEKLRIALTQIFWKRHKHGSDAHE
ncbi:MAG: XRE family transcriptional regulator [Lactobacillus sp.]|nr:MAG: XRE family transcriptional regulator [Lactobacillus sp.]